MAAVCRMGQAGGFPASQDKGNGAWVGLGVQREGSDLRGFPDTATTGVAEEDED